MKALSPSLFVIGLVLTVAMPAQQSRSSGIFPGDLIKAVGSLPRRRAIFQIRQVMNALSMGESELKNERHSLPPGVAGRVTS